MFPFFMRLYVFYGYNPVHYTSICVYTIYQYLFYIHNMLFGIPFKFELNIFLQYT
jgi:hypothetical protein